MVQNDGLGGDDTVTAGNGTNTARIDRLTQAEGVLPRDLELAMPSTMASDPARTVAEAEQWLAVIPPTAACYRLLQLGILRRDVALLEGLLSVLRNP